MQDGHKIQLEEVDVSETEGKILLPYGIGIDTHSKFIQVCVLIRKKDKIFRVEKDFQTMWPTLQIAKEFLHDTLKEYVPDLDPSLMHYCIESTSVYHYPIIHALGGVPHIVNPLLAGGTRRKTDVLDARTLAYQSITNLWRASFFPNPALINIRVIVGERKRCMKLRTQASNRINNILLRFGNTPFAKAGWGTYVRPIVEDLSEGRPSKAFTTSGIEIPQETRNNLKRLLKQWDESDELVKKHSKELSRCINEMNFKIDGKDLSGKKLIKLLTTVPGIGDLSAIIWLEEIYDISRFTSSKSCSAYCGCDPTLKVSAGNVTSFKTRGGNRTIYSMLLQAASALIQKRSEPFGTWGYRIYSVNRKGGWKKACCAVARRLSVALYWVHRRCEPFSYEKYNFYKTIQVPTVSLKEMNLGIFVERRLKKLHLETSDEVVQAYLTDLPREKGIGEKCLKTIKNWIQEHGTGYGSQARSSEEKRRHSSLRMWETPQKKQSTES